MPGRDPLQLLRTLTRKWMKTTSTRKIWCSSSTSRRRSIRLTTAYKINRVFGRTMARAVHTVLRNARSRPQRGNAHSVSHERDAARVYALTITFYGVHHREAPACAPFATVHGRCIYSELQTMQRNHHAAIPQVGRKDENGVQHEKKHCSLREPEAEPNTARIQPRIRDRGMLLPPHTRP